jgi:C4-dicarboxylate-specific signal transduction histidine kinase
MLQATNPASVLRGYAVAVLCAVAALVLSQALRNPVFPTPLFFAAISISTWYGGGLAGVFAVAFGTLALDYYFIPPLGSLSLNKPELPYLLEFALPALLTCWFVKKRKIAEISLRQSRDELASIVQERQTELARVSRMMTIGEMGVSVAHEVNQPLMAVVLNGDACLQWLAADPPNIEEARRTVSRIIEEGTRAGEVVRRIRTLSGKAAPQKSPVDLTELATEVVLLLGRELERHQVVLQTDLIKGLPTVRGDRVQLQQVIVNLAMNAIEAMVGVTGRSRELRLRTTRTGTGGAGFAVEDSGPGLPTGDPEQLFAPFYTTKEEGLGIGLAISRTIIEAHGGRLWAVDSGHGAVFEFELPVIELPVMRGNV